VPTPVTPTRICDACRAVAPHHGLFCGNCGHALTSAQPVTRPVAQERDTVAFQRPPAGLLPHQANSGPVPGVRPPQALDLPPGTYPLTASSSSVALLSAIAALIVVAAAGAAVAVILAISAGGSTRPFRSGLQRTTITVITHAQ
jgi:hypothetical protein